MSTLVLLVLFGAGELVMDNNVKEIQVIHNVTYDKTELPSTAARIAKEMSEKFTDARFTFKYEKETLYAATQNLGVFGNQELLLHVKHKSDGPTCSVYEVKAAQQLAEIEDLRPPFRSFLTTVTRLRHKQTEDGQVWQISETDAGDSWTKFTVVLDKKRSGSGRSVK